MSNQPKIIRVRPYTPAEQLEEMSRRLNAVESRLRALEAKAVPARRRKEQAKMEKHVTRQMARLTK